MTYLPHGQQGRENKRLTARLRACSFFVPPKALFSRLTRSDSKLEAGGDTKGDRRRALLCAAPHTSIFINSFLLLLLRSPHLISPCHRALRLRLRRPRSRAPPLRSATIFCGRHLHITKRNGGGGGRPDLKQLSPSLRSRDDLCVFSRVADKTDATAAAATM